MNFDEFHIVLIGSSEFPEDETLHPLPNVRVNIDALTEIFLDEEIVGVPKKNINVILDEVPSKTFMRLREILKNLQKSETLILYYSGHGVISTNDFKLYLSTIETNSNFIDDTCLNVDKLYDIIKSSKPKRKILILDCCHSGKILGAMANRESVIQNQIDKYEGLYVMTSTDEYSLATYDINNPSTPTHFTSNLIRVLQEGIEKREHYFSISDIYDEILSKQKNLNKPQQASKDYGHKILVAKNKYYNKDRIFSIIDELIEEGDFHKAENELLSLLNIWGNDQAVITKIEYCQVEKDYFNLVKDADYYFHSEEFEVALENYEAALKIKNELQTRIKISDCKQNIKLEKKYKERYTNPIEEKIKKLEQEYSKRFEDERKKLIEEANLLVKSQIEEIAKKYFSEHISKSEITESIISVTEDFLVENIAIEDEVDSHKDTKEAVGKLLGQLNQPIKNLSSQLQTIKNKQSKIDDEKRVIIGKLIAQLNAPMTKLITQIQTPQGKLIMQLYNIR